MHLRHYTIHHSWEDAIYQKEVRSEMKMPNSEIAQE